MRTGSADLHPEQSKLNRKPTTKLTIRRILPRFTMIQDLMRLTPLSGLYDHYMHDYYHNIPGNLHRPSGAGETEWSNTYNRWFHIWGQSEDSDADGFPELCMSYIPDPTSTMDWYEKSKSFRAAWRGDPWQQRCSLIGYRIYYLDGADLYTTTWSGSNKDFVTHSPTLYEGSLVGDGHYGCAAVDEDGTGEQAERVHVLSYYKNGDAQFIFLQCAESNKIVGTMEYAMPVDKDYTYDDGAFLDAEFLEANQAVYGLPDRDVIVFNRRKYGKAMIIFYYPDDDHYGEPRPLLDIDPVNRYSFFRAPLMKKYTDTGGRPYLLLTGAVGRTGTNNTYADTAVLMMRSNDGIHWTYDRSSYVTQKEGAGGVFKDGDHLIYTTYPGRNHLYGEVWNGDATWIFGADPESCKQTFTEDDILSWSLSQPTLCKGASATTSFKTYPTDLEPLQWVWREAGYSDTNIPMVVEEILSLRTGKQFTMSSREICVRALASWTSDQDWFWYQPTQATNNCETLSGLYGVSDNSFGLRDPDDPEMGVTIDNYETLAESDSGYLEVQAFNGPQIYLYTEPVAPRNYEVQVDFAPSERYIYNWSRPQNLNHTLETDDDWSTLGYGIGVVGNYIDNENYIALFLSDDGNNDSSTLSLIQCKDGDWTLLDSVNICVHLDSYYSIYRLALRRRGDRFEGEVYILSSSGSAEVGRMDWANGNRIDYRWTEDSGQTSEIFDTDATEYNFDRSSIGIIVEQACFQSLLAPVPAKTSYLARHWNTFAGSQPDDYAENSDIDYSIALGMEYAQDGTTYLHFGGESWRCWAVTAGNKKSPMYTVATCDGVPGSTSFDIVAQEHCPADEWAQWENDGQGSQHLLYICEGPGEGLYSVCDDATWLVPGDEFRVLQHFADYPALDEVLTTDSKFVLLPGYSVTNRPTITGTTEDQVGATAHGAGTLMRGHAEDECFYIHGLQAWDLDNVHKTRQYIAQDIFAKAGITNWDTEQDIHWDAQANMEWNCETVGSTSGNAEYYDSKLVDFDIRFELVTGPLSGTENWHLAFNLDNNLQYDFGTEASNPDSSTLEALNGFNVVTYYTDTHIRIELWGTKDTGAHDDEWNKLWEVERSGIDFATNPGTQVTFRYVRKGEFLTVYANRRVFAVLPLVDPVGAADYNYPRNAGEPGYLALAHEAGTSWTYNGYWVMDELHQCPPNLVGDVRSTAQSMFKRMRQDAHIKFLGTMEKNTSTPRPQVHIGHFTNDYRFEEHDIGDISDLLSTETNFPSGGRHVSIFSDQYNPTSRIPSTISVVGAEIVDYIDHEAAQQWGWSFKSYSTPSLDEKSCYKEAQTMSKQHRSYADTRQMSVAAQVHWEPEDQLTVDWETLDGRPEVDEVKYVIDSVSFQFAQASFTSKVQLRKYIE